MLTKDDVEIQIHIQREEGSDDYVPLEEYDDPHAEGAQAHDGQTQVKYVESQIGRKFKIFLKFPEGFHMHTADTISTGLRMDGGNIHGEHSHSGAVLQIQRKGPDGVLGENYEYSLYEGLASIDGTVHRVQFAFDKACLDGDDDSSSDGSDSNLGCICVSWQRRSSNGRIIKDLASKHTHDNAPTKKSVAEGVGHRVRLCEPRPYDRLESKWITKRLDGSNGLKAKVVFRYRPKETLERLGCIPYSLRPMHVPDPEQEAEMETNIEKRAEEEQQEGEALESSNDVPSQDAVTIENLQRKIEDQAAEMARLRTAMTVLLEISQGTGGRATSSTEQSTQGQIKLEAPSVNVESGGRPNKRIKITHQEVIELD